MWPDSMTRLRPLRNCAILSSKAPETMPIRLATMIRPPTVTTNISSRKPHPASAPIVPGSRVRIRLPHTTSQKSPSSASSGNAFSTITSTATAKTKPTVARASRPMIATGPRDITLSKAYRRRSRMLGRCTASPPRAGASVTRPVPVLAP